jgi:phosphatidylglycerophosphatase A
LNCRAEDSAISADPKDSPKDSPEGSPKGGIATADLKNPFVLLATGLGSGLAPKAPGTVGSLLALPIWWFLLADLPLVHQLAFVVIATVIAVWVVDRACRAAGVGDASAFVLDEFVGQWVALVAAPKSLLWAGVGFALFRAFDIAKPWPVSWADRSLAGGLGVVLDDVFAGVLAAVVLHLSVAAIPI